MNEWMIHLWFVINLQGFPDSTTASAMYKIQLTETKWWVCELCDALGKEQPGDRNNAPEYEYFPPAVNCRMKVVHYLKKARRSSVMDINERESQSKRG